MPALLQRGCSLNDVTPTNERSLRAHQAITLALLFAAGVVNFFDRSSLSIANTTVRAELHLSGTEMGWLLSAFSFAYGLSQLPLIGLLDRMGTRSILGTGLAIWSGAQLLTGLVTSFPMFIAFRILLGMGEAPFYPAGVRSVREWFTDRTRGRATAIMSSSQTFGLAIAPPLLTLLMIRTGWRVMFMILGAAGLVVAALWVWLHRSRAQTPYREAEAAPVTQSAFAELIRQRTAWGMMLGFGGINYTNWLYTAWLPGYLQQERHLSLAKSGWLAAIPFLAGAAGMLCSGFSADLWAKRGIRLTTLHRIQLVTGMIISAAATFFVSRAGSTAEAIAGISFALFFIHFAGTSGWGYVQTVSPARLVASLGALQNFASFVIASAAPVLTGWFFDRTHSFTLGFLVCASVTLLGALSYATLAAPDGMRVAD
ncbi:sugar phosphate permease [Terriglobus roseus DSM 18391]|uniref:Sugar phosphate permease n=1 Tax=Terriglobus roseus (strain DSM 18391 / NRRL B-41598 / KBS 63) TaxID=926566 RepID=I3ZMQ2_TERRK|nr:sugar phosphate permease [Terriglobus roseus DSM 18391]